MIEAKVAIAALASGDRPLYPGNIILLSSIFFPSQLLVAMVLVILEHGCWLKLYKLTLISGKGTMSKVCKVKTLRIASDRLSFS